METRWIDTKDQAKMIRQSLKEAFPGVKFSVRMERYSGGSSIDVRWTDGPNKAQVEAVIARFRSGGFDAMQDLSYSIGRYLEGEPVRFGASFLFTHRKYSREFVERYGPRAARKAGINEPVEIVGSDSFGWHLARISDYGAEMTASRELEKYTLVPVVQESRTAKRVGTYAEVPSYIQ